MDSPGNSNFIFNHESPYNWRNPHNDNLWQGLNGVSNPCPDGYRIPTQKEWKEEMETWISQDAIGTFTSPLKLPMAGSRNHGSTHLDNVDTEGNYWSSTPEDFYSHHLNFTISNSSIYPYQRGEGFSIRCIQD